MSNPDAPAIVWFRDDLRLIDQPALYRAAASGRPLVCVFVSDPAGAGRSLGGAARWWLHGALASLDRALRARGGELVLLRGDEAATIEGLAVELGAGAVYWNRRYALGHRTLDSGLKAALKARGIVAESGNAALLNEPWEVLTGAGKPYQVFTAYWRAARAGREVAPPLPEPESPRFLPLPPALAARRAALPELGLLPVRPDWSGGLRDAWRCGEDDALDVLREFLARRLRGYTDARDRPDQPATSRLSPYLRFGQLSARQIWHAAQAAAHEQGAAALADLDKFLSELGWREFCYGMLYALPDLSVCNVRRQFDAMPWRRDPAALAAWQRGMTGYPLVDAGMRELWATGWMHNRVRMVAASFLVKHLLLDWRDGEAWFWDTLVDADPASNAANWQWVAGCGADAAPYFRIFNPVLQGQKFDPDGDYVRRWVPALARLPAGVIHAPWRARPEQLAAAGVRLGADYPLPIVEHDAARARALAALEQVTRG